MPKRFLLFVIAFLLAGCNLAAPPANPTPGTTPIVGAPEQPLTPVTFLVTVPTDTPPDQPIQFSLLDEVTGLAINPTRYTMEEKEDFIYEITLDLPVGSVIQYRYSRQASLLAEEHLADGRSVRYRLYKVDGPSNVHDVVTRWNDTLYNLPAGRIAGTVTDSTTGQPIPNLLIAAGGAQTLTAWDGTFRIEGLPVGTHNLVAYALDGTYHTFQQGAVVAENASTPAEFSVIPTTFVDVTFRLTVPEDTIPAIPVRIAGNLYQFGNTFANLSGGLSVPAARMPVMAYQEDGSYALTMKLPAGIFLRYKYTLGDGFWNAERDLSGGVPLREVVIPPEGLILQDTVQTWASVGKAPVWFDVIVPADTLPEDTVSLQLNPWGWTQPLPMWKLAPNHWVYLLSSPLDVLGKVTYRYCRNDQCGSADDVQTAGQAVGRPLALGSDFLSLSDTVSAWQWPLAGAGATPTGTATPRGTDFLSGVELLPAYHPTWSAYLPSAYDHIRALNANSVVLSPTWTFVQVHPLSFEVLPGEDMPWLDLRAAMQAAKERGLNVALFPTPRFGSPADLWWETAPRDVVWWLDWFDAYEAFALHHASLAERNGVNLLVLGGDWLNPALPNGFMPDGFSSNVPANAEERWRDILNQVRAAYSGKVAWALPYPQGIQNPPPFLDQVDEIYLLWSPQIAVQADATGDVLRSEIARLLDNFVQPFAFNVQKPVILAMGYPSADGAMTGCLPGPEGGCLPFNALSQPNPNPSSITLDLAEQWEIYAATLEVVNERAWLAGVVSRGFYPPAALADPSLSIHGKPAQQVLQYWFLAWGEK
ncbi:MAG: hypothetical protein Fur0022_16740 [Anaerolineales bacterium]